MPSTIHTVTEDDVFVFPGTRVYNYYDMKPGVIENIRQDDFDEAVNLKRDLWFYVKHDDGSKALLNGERICTIEFAKRRGFKNAS
jgi:hypothetical protein